MDVPNENENTDQATDDLNFSALYNALEQLKESLYFLHSDLGKDARLYAQFRSASIQAFEYCYELSHKSLKRFLMVSAASQDAIIDMTFSELVRTGYEKGLLKHSWSMWREYRDMKNRSSHAYCVAVADDVTASIPAFLEDALYLYKQLQAKKGA